MTKYYKLLKDLPTFKKGDLFKLSDEGSLFLMNPDSRHWKSQVMAYHHSTLEHFPNILEDWFKEVDAPNGRWEPKVGDKYWHINAYSNGVGTTTWYGDDIDRAVNENGNVFRTEEDAEKAVKWLKARKVLFDDAKGFKPNWKDDQEHKWSVIWDWDGIRLFADFCFSETSSPGPYFATKEDAKASIKAHEREWKIYLLGSDSND